MAQYHKKPVVIEAVQFDPHKHPWPDGVIPWREVGYQPRDMSWGFVETLEAKMHVLAGDYIITGIAGEKYPCKPDIFHATYEPIEAEKGMSLSKPQCKMRRFYLVRHEDSDPDQISGTGVIAEGVIFEDGMVAMRWKTRWKSTAIYDNIKELLAIHGHGGKTELKFIDVEGAGS